MSDKSAIFGTVLFGETYFGELRIAAPAQGPADGCGGTFGSITFGSPYFGQLIDCGSEPPVPPDTGFTGKSSGTGRRRRKRFVIPAGPNRREEEEIALIVGAWLNVTN